MKSLLLKTIAALFAGRALRHMLCWRGPRAKQAVALTFDDGPNDHSTPEVLNILRQHKVRATFFLLGRELEKCPGRLDDILADGHTVGIHGYDHRFCDLRGQVARCAELLAKSGQSTGLIRPPAGRADLRGLLWARSRKYSTVLWSFDVHDSMRHEGKWHGPDPDLEQVQAGDIILMHDDNPVCLDDLPRLIDAVRANGLQFVSVAELLGLPLREGECGG